MPRVVEYFRQSLKAALFRRSNMVTFANVGSVRLPSLGLRVRNIRRIQCVSCLSTTVSQLFIIIIIIFYLPKKEAGYQKSRSSSYAEPQLQKNRHFYVPRPSFFCLPWGRPCGNHAKRCMNEKTIQCLPNSSQHVPIYLEQFPSYSNRKCNKSQFSRTAAHILRLSLNMSHGQKDNSMLAKLLAACTYLSSIVSELYDA